MKDFNLNSAGYEVVKDASTDWPSSTVSFLGTAPLEDAPPLLTNREKDVLIDLTLNKADDITTSLAPILEQLESHASSFQAQSISIILDELSTNAIHHSGSNTNSIKVICQRSLDKGIAITVIDDGGKLPVAQIKALFKERTIPVSPRNDPNKRGAGLGLFFCREFSSGIFINLVEGTSTSVTCFVPYRPSKKSTLIVALVEVKRF